MKRWLRDSLLALLAAACGFGAAALFTTASSRTEGSAGARLGAEQKSTAEARAGAAGEEEGSLPAVLGLLRDRPTLHSLAQLSGLLEKLDVAQMRVLMEKCKLLPTEESEALLPMLLARWTARDPEAATEWFRPRLEAFARDPSFANGFADFDTAMAEAWAGNAPQLAAEMARRAPDSGFARKLLKDAMYAWPEKDYAARLALVRDFPAGSARRDVMRALFHLWAQTNADAALSAAAALPPGPERSSALSQVLRRRAERDPLAALAQISKLGVGAEVALVESVVTGAAARDPATTAQWLEKQDAAMLASAGRLLAAQWAERDAVAALEWARTHGVSLTERVSTLDYPGGESVGSAFVRALNSKSPLATALERHPDATLAWVRALPAGAERERFIELAIRQGRQPADMLPLLAELSPEAAARSAWRLGRSFGLQRNDEAQRWAAGLPAGPVREEAWAGIGAATGEPLPLSSSADRDALLRGMAEARAGREPATAAGRALEISNAALRRQVFDDVMSVWLEHADPTQREAAHRWLSEAAVPEEWKSRRLERAR